MINEPEMRTEPTIASKTEPFKECDQVHTQPTSSFAEGNLEGSTAHCPATVNAMDMASGSYLEELLDIFELVIDLLKPRDSTLPPSPCPSIPLASSASSIALDPLLSYEESASPWPFQEGPYCNVYDMPLFHYVSVLPCDLVSYSLFN